MPLASFYDWWDSYLSAALYSGNIPQARIEVSEAIEAALPPEVRKHVIVGEVQQQAWAMEELNVPPHPSPRVTIGFARNLAKLDDSPGSVILELDGPPNWRTGIRHSEQIALP